MYLNSLKHNMRTFLAGRLNKRLLSKVTDSRIRLTEYYFHYWLICRLFSNFMKEERKRKDNKKFPSAFLCAVFILLLIQTPKIFNLNSHKTKQQVITLEKQELGNTK